MTRPAAFAGFRHPVLVVLLLIALFPAIVGKSFNSILLLEPRRRCLIALAGVAAAVLYAAVAGFPDFALGAIGRAASSIPAGSADGRGD